jgi:hypothetical protein
MNETMSSARSSATTATRDREIQHLRAKLLAMIAEREAQKRAEKEAPERE